MRKHGLRASWAALILPVAITAGISVLAFGRAEITSGATMTVSTSDQAALAVLPADSYANGAGGQVRLHFPEQQPNTTYTYKRVFKVNHNSSAASVSLSVASVTGESSPGAHITLQDSDTGIVYWKNGAAVSSRTLTAIDFEATFDVVIDMDPGAPVGSDISLAITLNAQ